MPLVSIEQQEPPVSRDLPDLLDPPALSDLSALLLGLRVSMELLESLGPRKQMAPQEPPELSDLPDLLVPRASTALLEQPDSQVLLDPQVHLESQAAQ